MSTQPTWRDSERTGSRKPTLISRQTRGTSPGRVMDLDLDMYQICKICKTPIYLAEEKSILDEAINPAHWAMTRRLADIFFAATEIPLYAIMVWAPDFCDSNHYRIARYSPHDKKMTTLGEQSPAYKLHEDIEWLGRFHSKNCPGKLWETYVD